MQRLKKNKKIRIQKAQFKLGPLRDAFRTSEYRRNRGFRVANNSLFLMTSSRQNNFQDSKEILVPSDDYMQHSILCCTGRVFQVIVKSHSQNQTKLQKQIKEILLFATCFDIKKLHCNPRFYTDCYINNGKILTHKQTFLILLTTSKCGLKTESSKAYAIHV